MSNMHRLLWFDQEIRANKFPNSKKLAEQFEISVRQANRDLDYLKHSLGAPLLYVAKQRGYIYEDNAFVLPHVFISEEEQKALAYLAFRYEQFNPTPRMQRMADLFKRLVEEKKDTPSLPIFDLDQPLVHIVHALKSAIDRGVQTEISYTDPIHGSTRTLLMPYKLFRRYDADYLVAGIAGAEQEIVYRLERITDVLVTDLPSLAMPDRIDKKYGSHATMEPFVARIQCERPLPAHLQFGLFQRERDGEELIYEVEFFDADELIGQLMSSREWRAILSPRWLRERLKQRCYALLEKLH